MRKLFLSLAALALSHLPVFAGGDPQETPGATAPVPGVVIPGFDDGPQPTEVYFPPGFTETEGQLLIYDADGNLAKVERVTLPCIPNQEVCPDTSGLTLGETRARLLQRIEASPELDGLPPTVDWRAFSTVP